MYRKQLSDVHEAAVRCTKHSYILVDKPDHVTFTNNGSDNGRLARDSGELICMFLYIRIAFNVYINTGLTFVNAANVITEWDSQLLIMQVTIISFFVQSCHLGKPIKKGY